MLQLMEKEVLSTHVDDNSPCQTFPPADIQALNFRRAQAVAGALAARGIVKVDFNDPEWKDQWASLVHAISLTLNTLEIKW